MSSTQDLAIRVEKVSKSFKLPHEKSTSIKSVVLNIFKNNRTFEKQKVLNNISFNVKRGEFLGIVGRNGSGKSTLLKMLAGIYTPNEGKIEVNGKLTPFIELGVGFNPDLTGRENVFLNGALLGFNRKETLQMYDEIVRFAELERFMDQKLKNYSSGMQVRLAFSIAIRAQSDILLFDEVLAVGDAAFQQKCYDVFEKMSEDGRTVVLVTHDMSAVQRFCQRAILISKGNIEMIGKPSDVADRYLEQNYSGKIEHDSNLIKERKSNILVADVKLDGRSNGSNYSLHQAIECSFVVNNLSEEKDLRIGMQIFSNAGVYCFGTNSRIAQAAPLSSKKSKVKLTINQSLVPGNYSVTLAIMNKNARKVLHYLPKAATFNIKQETEEQGVSLMESKWEITSV